MLGDFRVYQFRNLPLFGSMNGSVVFLVATNDFSHSFVARLVVRALASAKDDIVLVWYQDTFGTIGNGLVKAFVPSSLRTRRSFSFPPRDVIRLGRIYFVNKLGRILTTVTVTVVVVVVAAGFRHDDNDNDYDDTDGDSAYLKLTQTLTCNAQES